MAEAGCQARFMLKHISQVSTQIFQLNDGCKKGVQCKIEKQQYLFKRMHSKLHLIERLTAKCKIVFVCRIDLDM